MLTLRQRIFIYISIFIGLIIAGILIYLFVNNSGGVRDYLKQKSGQILNVNNGPVNQTATTTPTLGVVKAKPLTPDVYVKQLSRIFVERFGTYSNQNNNSHISEVSSLCTKTMVNWLKTQKLTNSSEYFAVTTKMIAGEVVKLDNNSAVVQVQVQQILENKNGQQVVQKNGQVELLKVAEDWKVDGLYWEKQ